MADPTAIMKQVTDWRKTLKTIEAEIEVYEKAESYYKQIREGVEASNPDTQRIMQLCAALEGENSSPSANLVSAVENFVRITRWACETGITAFIGQYQKAISEEEQSEQSAAIKRQVVKWKKAFEYINPNIIPYNEEAVLYFDILSGILKKPTDLAKLISQSDTLVDECQGLRSNDEKIVTNVNSFSAVLKQACKSTKSFGDFMAGLNAQKLTAVIKKEVENFGKKNVEDGPSIRIKKIEFANTDYNRNPLSPFGLSLYDNVQYLTPRIYFDNIIGSGKVTLYTKLFSPDGTLDKSKSSPDGYTNSEEFTLNESDKSRLLVGWGSNKGTFYTPGKWCFEVWEKGKILIKEYIEIKAWNTPSIKINRVEFGSIDKEGKLIDEYGSKLYNNIKYLSPRIFYDNLRGSKHTITLHVKIFGPDGKLLSGNGSPARYTYSQAVTLDDDLWSNVSGWGNNEGNTYIAGGVWRFEFWENGKLLFKASATIKKKRKGGIGKYVVIALILAGGWAGYTYVYVPYSTEEKIETVEAPAYEEYEINSTNPLNVRVKPKDGKVLGGLQKGERIKVFEIVDGWAKIEYNGGIGYVSSNYIKKIE